MELLRRLLGEGDGDCNCGHPTGVHWRRDEGHGVWCSAPGCTCSQEFAAEDLGKIRVEEGDGFRIVPPGERRRRTARLRERRSAAARDCYRPPRTRPGRPPLECLVRIVGCFPHVAVAVVDDQRQGLFPCLLPRLARSISLPAMESQYVARGFHLHSPLVALPGNCESL